MKVRLARALPEDQEAAEEHNPPKLRLERRGNPQLIEERLEHSKRVFVVRAHLYAQREGW